MSNTLYKELNAATKSLLKMARCDFGVKQCRGRGVLRTHCSAALDALWRGLSPREPVFNVRGLFRSKHI